MNKIKLILGAVSLTVFLFSCNRTDFSNPEDVLKSYRNLRFENKNEKLYDEFLSAKSKEFVTKDEYIKVQNIPDSISKISTLLESKIYTLPIDINNPSLRRLKVEEKRLLKSDTVYDKYYYTLSNENGKWKVIWTETLLSFAGQKFYGGNYSEARKAGQKIIEIDPYSARNYDLLAEGFLRDKSLSRNEWENGIVKNAKYSITLEEDMPNHYNVLAAYYSEVGNSDLAIETYKRGLEFCLNNNDRIIFYSNLSGEYMDANKYDTAEKYIIKSIEINNQDAFTWLQYGRLMEAQHKYKKAIEYYDEALSKSKMENALQGELFYHYAYCARENGDCSNAKEYINKALDIDPNNDTYQSLYHNIKNCK